jgi:hypothetical protein
VASGRTKFLNHTGDTAAFEVRILDKGLQLGAPAENTVTRASWLSPFARVVFAVRQ